MIALPRVMRREKLCHNIGDVTGGYRRAIEKIQRQCAAGVDHQYMPTGE